MRPPAALLGLAALALAGCKGVDRPPEVRRVVATIEGAPVYLDEFEAAYGEFTSNGELSPPVGEREATKRHLLDNLIDEHLLLRESEVRRVTVSDNELDAAVSALSNGYEQVAFSDLLVERRMTQAQFRETVRRRLLVQKVLDAEVYSRVAITEEQVAAYFEEHAEEFEMPERVHALHIVVQTDELAQQIHGRLRSRKGMGFAAAAREYSLAPEANKGGDLGFFPRGVMPAVFDEVCFSLRVGKISDVVPSEYGYHLFKVIEKERGHKRSLDQVASEIRARLRSLAKREAERAWLDELRRRAHIERDEALLAAVR